MMGQSVMQLCKDTMIDLGRCIDRMAATGYEEDASCLCAKLSNAMYFMCTAFHRMVKNDFPGNKEEIVLHFTNAMQALRYACIRYADAPNEQEVDGIVDGMKALHVFTHAQHTLNQLLKNSQAAKESSTS